MLAHVLQNFCAVNWPPGAAQEHAGRLYLVTQRQKSAVLLMVSVSP